MSLVRHVGSIWYAITDDALDDKGYVLSLLSTGHVHKAAAGEIPVGVAFKSTKDPISDTAASGVEVGIVSEGVAEVQYYLEAGDSNIAIGDLVMAHQSQAGYITKYTEDDTTTAWPATYAAATAETITDEIIAASRKSKYIVGVALEAVTAPGSGSITGTIKVVLRSGRR